MGKPNRAVQSSPRLWGSQVVPRVRRSRLVRYRLVVLRVGRSRMVRYRPVGPMMESDRMAPKVGGCLMAPKVGGCRMALSCQVPARRNVPWLQQALPP